MKIAPVTDQFSVADQITADDVGEIARLGFRSVINNRPDGEQPGQPTSDELRQAAEQSGLSYRYVPITPGQMGDAEVRAFSEAIKALPKPVLGFCRSGTRAISLYTLASAGTASADALIARAGKAGYDLSGLKNRL